METSVYSKPSDSHTYLNYANSCHPRSQIRGIAKGVALRLRRIYVPKRRILRPKSKEYSNYLINCGHDKDHVLEKFNEVSSLSREEARTRRYKPEGSYCVFSVKYSLRGPNIRKVIRKYQHIIENDERAREVLPIKGLFT